MPCVIFQSGSHKSLMALLNYQNTLPCPFPRCGARVFSRRTTTEGSAWSPRPLVDPFSPPRVSAALKEGSVLPAPPDELFISVLCTWKRISSFSKGNQISK